MTWTWDETSLSTALSQVRVTIGDTNSASQLLSDEMINWRLSQVDDDVRQASVACVKDIIAKLARDYDRSNIGMSVTRSQQIQHYKDLLNELTSDASSLCEMYVGGISDDEKDTEKDDSDFPYHEFGIGRDDNA